MTEPLLSLIIATLLLLGSPGPATMALAATGATHGFKAGIPFLLGILLGLLIAITGAALGLAALFPHFPTLQIVMQLLGASYIFYLAWKIATAPVSENPSESLSSTPSFTDGFIVNLLNIKAYAVFLALFSQFLLPADNSALAYLSTGFVCIVMATIIDVLWLWLGSVISPYFSDPVSARKLRAALALLMVAAVLWVLLP